MPKNYETICPTCLIVARTEDQIYNVFGFRKIKNSHGKIKSIPQSLCRICRRNHKKNKLKIKDELIPKKSNNSSLLSMTDPIDRLLDAAELGEYNSSLQENLDNLDIEKFTNDWNSGMRLVDLAEKYNFPYADKSKHIAKKLGLKERTRQKLSKKLFFKINTDNFSKDWENGLSLIDLAKKYELFRPENAKKIAQDLELEERKTNPTKIFQNLNIEKFAQMYNDKSIKIKEIVKEFNLPQKYHARLFATKLGLQIRRSGFPNGGKFEIFHVQFKKLWENEISVKQIEKTLGITSATIDTWKKRLNLENRGSGNKQKPKFNLEIKKIIEYFEENSDVTTLSEITKKIKLDRKTLKTFFKLSDDFQLFPLVSKNKFLLKLLDDYAGDDIVIQKNDYKQGYKILHHILLHAKNTLDIRMFLNYVNEIFSVKLIVPRNVTFNEFPYSLRLAKFKPIIDIEKNSKIYEQCITKTSFGYDASSDNFIEKLNNSGKEEQTILIKSMFYSLGFEIVSGNNTCDFFIKTEKLIPVKLEIYRKLTKGDFQVFSTLIKNHEGVIITLQEIEKPIFTLFDNIAIFDKNLIRDIINSTSFLPARKNSMCLIQEGDEMNLGKIVTVNEIYFEQNIAKVVELLSGNLIRIPLFALKELSNFETKNKDEFLELLKNLDQISNSFNKYSIVPDSFVINYLEIQNKLFINARIGDRSVSLHYNPNLNFVGSENFPSPVGYCRYELIKCNCLEWQSQHENYYLCEHLTFFLYYIWKNKLLEPIKPLNNDETNYSTYSQLISITNEINFLLNDCLKIENYWRKKLFDLLKQNKRKAILYNYLFVYVIQKNMDVFKPLEFRNELKNYLLINDDFISFNYSENDLVSCFNEVKNDIKKSKLTNITPNNFTKKQTNRLGNSLILGVSSLISELKI